MLKAHYSSNQERCEAYEETIKELQYELHQVRLHLRDMRIEFDRQVVASEEEANKQNSMEMFYHGRSDAFKLLILALDRFNL